MTNAWDAIRDMSNESVKRGVVGGLSELIARDVAALSSEEKHPGSSPDASDDEIKIRRARIDVLRKMREAFEAVMWG